MLFLPKELASVGSSTMAPTTESAASDATGVTKRSNATDNTASSKTANSFELNAGSSKRKVLKRVRKAKDSNTDDSGADASVDRTATAVLSANLGANVWKTLSTSKVYFALLALRFVLLFITPGSLEGIEFADGVDTLASALLPGISSGGEDPLLPVPPQGLGEHNQTRSIVGAFITSGIPFMGINAWCTKVAGSCSHTWIGYLAFIVPRIWMFFISLITDVLLVRCFAVYEGHNAQYGLITYASTWTTLLAMPRNLNFSLEAMCVTAIVAACFGWKPNVARPLFWLSASALSLGIFLRPPFAFFVFTPLIYLSSLWGKPGIQPLRYVRAALEGLAVFAFWTSIWVSVDSVYFGTFKLRFGDVVMENFDMFLEYCNKGLPFSYKGSLVYTPINAMRTIANRQVFKTLTTNTSPGQMFLSLPAILGPLFVVLVIESYDGMKVAVKELMTELKTVANSKKPKKRRAKKAGMTKELEDELYVYFDTIQTTFLLGLLIEVVQNHDRLGTISLLSLIPPCIVCIAGRVFGPESFSKFRILHIVFTVAAVVFYGFLNHSGIPRVLLRAGAGGIEAIPSNAGIVVHRGVIGHRALLGPNVKNISVHNGGESHFSLMTKLRELKSEGGFDEDQLLVLAAGTVRLKEEFKLVETVAYGHMSAMDMPSNIDDAVRKSTLKMYKFTGDEDEAIIREDEEAAEEEERLREEKERQKKKKKVDDADEL